MCTKAHLQSLQVNCMVDSSVIDAWSYVLNANEALRANTSPYRVFMTTETTVSYDYTEYRVSFIFNVGISCTPSFGE